MATRLRRVFVSYDFDNDKVLKDFIVGQAKNSDSPFEIADHSLKEEAPEATWLEKATAAIKRSDTVIFMLGPKTGSAPGVKKEAKVAKDLDKHRFQVIGYSTGEYTSVTDGGTVHKWNWDTLKALLARIQVS